MTREVKEAFRGGWSAWINPHLVTSVISLVFLAGSFYATTNWRATSLEKLLTATEASLSEKIDNLKKATDARINGLETRVNRLDGDGEVVRLQEQNRELRERVAELRTKIEEVEGVQQARYDHIMAKFFEKPRGRKD